MVEATAIRKPVEASVCAEHFITDYELLVSLNAFCHQSLQGIPRKHTLQLCQGVLSQLFVNPSLLALLPRRPVIPISSEPPGNPYCYATVYRIR